jgi:hypothetical protein
VLAKVNLPSLDTNIEEVNIDNFVRRQLYSTAVLQEELIKCCCDKKEPRPVRVISIDPEKGKRFTLTAGTAGIVGMPTHIDIRFDKNLRSETVNTDTVRVTVHKPDSSTEPVSGSVVYHDEGKFALFKPDKPFGVGEGMGEGDEFRYEVLVQGEDPNPIRDVDDLALDGKGDSTSGTNFTSHFFLVFQIQ